MFPTPQFQQNAFQTPGSQNAGGFAQRLGNYLSSNTRPFNPAAAGNFAAPASGINFGALSMAPGLGSPLKPNTPFKISTPSVVSSKQTQTAPTTNDLQAARSQYESAANYSSPASATYSTGAYGTATTDTTGTTTNTLPTAQPQNPYAQYAKQLATAFEYSPEYLQALQQSNQAKIQEQQLQANLLDGNVQGDTYGFAQGLTAKAETRNQITQALANVQLQTQELMRQGNIAGAKALVDAYAPQGEGVGQSLVSAATGQAIYQSPYMFKPTAASYDQVAQQLLQSGQATNYADAYNMAQGIVNASASGQQGFSGSADVTQSPTYTNAMQLLQQGVPPGQVLSQVGRSQVAKSYAERALADFLAQNKGYNAVQAQSNAKAASDLIDQQANVARAIDTADQNFQLLINLADKAKINDQTSPITNQLNNALQRGVIGNGDINQFDTGIQTLRTEYAQVLARGGTVTDSVRGEANRIIPDNISLTNLRKVYNYIKTEGGNVVGGYDTQVQKLLNQKPQPAPSGTVSWDSL